MNKFLILLALLTSQMAPGIRADLNMGKGEIKKENVDIAGPVKVTESLGMEITAKSAIVVDRKSKKILFEKNSYERMAMASLTKLMTAIVFLENKEKKLSDKYMIPMEATQLIGADIELLQGEELSYKDLFWGALAGSGNDAALSLVLSLGSKRDFIEKMNKKAIELGLENTHFNGVTGLDEKDHFSTAYDISKLLDIALGSEKIKEALQVKEFDVHSLNTDNVHHVITTNRLLRYDYPRMKGGKTGYTENAGFCLASWSADDNRNEIIVVVLGSDLNGNQFQDTKALIDWTYGNYKFN